LKLNVSLQSELRGWRSFCHWLMQRAAGQVQRLDLTADGEEDCTAEDRREVVCMMAACVVACCTAGGLTELRWCAAEYDVRLGGWVAALRGLTRLDMTVHDSDLELAASLHTLTDLQQLKIDGKPAEAWHPAVRLPASLTKLHLNCHMGHASLPHQVSSGGGASATWQQAHAAAVDTEVQACHMPQDAGGTRPGQAKPGQRHDQPASR
jgi:hypothetical protein